MRRTLVTVVLAAGVGVAAGYLLGRGPGWVLWENRGTTVHATTEFFSTQSGCLKTRDAWNMREETTRQDEWAKWRKENPNPAGLAKLAGPFVIYLGYECYPVGVNPGAQRFPLAR
jgi:hypothetical protein